MLFGVVCDPSGAQGTLLSMAVHEASQPCALDPCDQICDSLIISLGIHSVSFNYYYVVYYHFFHKL